MADWPIRGGQTSLETGGVVTASSLATALATPGGANTKGAWTELIASTAFHTCGFFVVLRIGPNAGSHLIDIGIGASSSEVVIVENILHHQSQSQYTSYSFFCPIDIPSGTRISARSQNDGTDVASASVILCAKSYTHANGLARCTTYGAATADSGGTSVDPGGTINTKAVTQISASTTNPIRSLVLVVGGQLNGTRSAMSWLVDICVGSAGNEKVVIPNLPFVTDTYADNIYPHLYGPFDVYIPSGSRLSVRAQCSANDATDRIFDAVIYGFD